MILFIYTSSCNGLFVRFCFLLKNSSISCTRVVVVLVVNLLHNKQRFIENVSIIRKTKYKRYQINCFGPFSDLHIAALQRSYTSDGFGKKN